MCISWRLLSLINIIRTISYLLLQIRSIILRVIKLLFSRGLGPFPLSFHPLSSQPWTQGDHQIKKIKWNTKSKSNHVFKISPPLFPTLTTRLSLSFIHVLQSPPTHPPKTFPKFPSKAFAQRLQMMSFFHTFRASAGQLIRPQPWTTTTSSTGASVLHIRWSCCGT